ncbi:MAG TPA: hypothetical protein VNG95_05495 [Gemmatimonadales bacterium]|nr:hypothetical protein [Gemmatimonadales bacterium]
MSELRAALALGLALTAAPALRGQTIPELRGRIARLEMAQRVAVAAQHRLDSARSVSPSEGLDTARHAALTLLALPRDVTMARDAVAEAWPALERTYGSHTADLGRKDFHLIVARDPQGPTGVPRGPVVPVIVAGDADVHDVARRLALSAGQVMSSGLDTALHRWIQNIYPLDAQFDEVRRRDVYQELVTAPWIAIRRCFIGDVARCRQALGLTGGADPAIDWYAPEDRARLAFERSSRGGESTAEVALRKSCVEQHQDADCLVLLHRLPREFLDPPLTTTARSTLVATALELGGAGAYDRLLAHPRAPLADRLEDAAGVPADSLIAVWRNRVTALAPMSAKVPARSAWAAFGWAVVFGVLALRSSRWR